MKRSVIFCFLLLIALSMSACNNFYDNALRELKDAQYDLSLVIKAILSDSIQPTVTSVIPDVHASDVARNMTISAIFSENIDPGSVTPSSFTVTRNGTLIYGSIQCMKNTVTFKPSSNLEPGTIYDISISTDLKDKAGNTLDEQFNWYFITGTDIDTTPPTVTCTFPQAHAGDAPINTSISTVFSENIDPATVTADTVIVTSGGIAVPGGLSCINNTIIFKPATDMAPRNIYSIEITAAIKDLAGNAMASGYSWDFSTSDLRDEIPPSVAMTQPQNMARGIDADQRIAVYFSEPIDPSTVTTSSFHVTKNGHPINGTILCTNNSAIFRPLFRLDGNSLYRVMVTTKITDMAGNRLNDPCLFTFSTASGRDTTPPSIIEVSPADNIDNAASVKVRFNEDIQYGAAMTVSYEDGADKILLPGGPSYNQNEKTLEFIPTAGKLARYRRYHVTVAGIKDLAGNPMSIAEYAWSFVVGPYIDTIKPYVDNVYPAPIEPPGYYSSISSISAHFNEEIQDGASMTVHYEHGSDRIHVSGTASYTRDDRMIQFIPDSGTLPLYRQYHVSISGVKDLADNPMETDEFKWSFIVGPYTDTKSPEIVRVTPAEISINNTLIGSVKVFFSEDIEPDASMKVCYVQGANCIDVSGAKSYNQNEWSLQFVPDAGTLERYRQYRVTVSNVRDRANNSMAPAAPWLFWAGAIQVQLESASNQYHGFATFGSNGINHGFTLRDNWGSPLNGFINFDQIINSIMDPGISGPLGSDKYLRIVHRDGNISSLGLTPVVKVINDPQYDAPENGTYYIDPVSGRLLLPRPSYWSKFETIDEITNPMLQDDKNLPSTSEYHNIITESIAHGKFGNTLVARSIINGASAELYNTRDIYPFGSNKLNHSKGTVSAWVRLYVSTTTNSILGKAEGRGSVVVIHLDTPGIAIYDFFVALVYSIDIDGNPSGVILINGLTDNSTSNPMPMPIQISTNCILNDFWHHIYIVWDISGHLAGSKLARVWVDGIERASVPSFTAESNYLFPNLSSSILSSTLNAYCKTEGLGVKTADSQAQIDNLKFFRGVTIEDPSWEYNNGAGRENALHYIYGPDPDGNPEYDYRPRLTGPSSGVGY